MQTLRVPAFVIAFCLISVSAASAQPPDTPDTAREIVAQANEVKEAINSGRITYKEISGTTAKTEARITVVFDEDLIRTERAGGTPGAAASDTRQGGIRNGSLWTQYTGAGSDPANWRVHSEVFDPGEESEATAANYDPRLFRVGAFPRTWAPRTRIRELMTLSSILTMEPLVGQTPTGDVLLAGKRKRPFEAEVVFEVDERRAWSLVNVQVSRRVPLADGSVERWVHKAAIEPAQYGMTWFPARYVWTKEVDGRVKQRYELVTLDAEFNIDIDPVEFTLKGIKGLPAGVKVTRNFEGSETRTWNGSKLVDSAARP